MKTFIRSIWLFYIMALLSCSQLYGEITPIYTPTSIIQTSNSLPTIFFTESPIISKTPTTYPTLSTEDANRRLFELLFNNGNCHLPCLWGITPGETTYENAQSNLMLLNTLSGRTKFSAEGGSLSLKFVKDDLLLGTYVAFNVDPLSSHHVVNRVGLSASVVEKKDNQFLIVFDSDFF